MCLHAVYYYLRIVKKKKKNYIPEWELLIITYSLNKAIEYCKHMSYLFILLFSSGHQEILRAEGKCNKFDPVPLVLVKDIMNYMPQMKYMFANVASSATDSAAKRQRLSWPELLSAVDPYSGSGDPYSTAAGYLLWFFNSKYSS